MTNRDRSEDTDAAENESPAVQALISRRHLGAATILALLSLIDEWQVVPGLKISGGVTLIALAAVILLWPLVRQIATRGGEIDLKGLRLKVNRIENEAQRVETDNAIRILELESEVECLRQRIPEAQQMWSQEPEGRSPTAEPAVPVLEWAVEAYRRNSVIQEFRSRIEIDKEIVLRGRVLYLSTLRDFLQDQRWNAKAQMAVAVAIGLPPKGDE